MTPLQNTQSGIKTTPPPQHMGHRPLQASHPQPEPDSSTPQPHQSPAISPEATDPPESSANETGFRPVLKNHSFLMLWTGQVFSQIADKVYLVLMIALIASRFQTTGQTISGWVSLVMIAFTVPAVLLGSIAGVLVDWWSKKYILVLTNLCRGALVILLLPLLWLSRDWGQWLGIPLGFWFLLGGTFWVSTLTQFFAPAEQAVIPLIVKRQHLLSANSLYTLTMMLAVIVGFAAGDPLLALAGSLSEHLGGSVDLGYVLVVGGSYGLAGLLLAWVVADEPSKSQTSPTQQVWSDLLEGLRYLKHQKRVRSAMMQLVMLFSVLAAITVIVVRLAEVLPAIKASQFGFLLAAGGVGMACSIGVIGQLGHRFSHRQLSFYGAIGMAVMLVGLSFSTQSLWLALVLLAGLGICTALIGIPMQTTIQQETPKEIRGKVFGLQNNAVNIALSLPLALTSLADTWFGLERVFLGLAVIVVTGGLFAWYISDTGASSHSDTLKIETDLS